MPRSGVDRELGELRAEAVDGVGRALAVGVERRGRRVEGRLGGEDVAVARRRAARRGRCRARRRSTVERGRRRARARASGPALAWRRIAARRLAAGGSAALPETKVWREAEVLPASGVRSVSASTRSKAATGRPSASAQIWAITVFEPWPMSTAPWCSTTAPSAREADADRRGVGQRGVAAAVPACWRCRRRGGAGRAACVGGRGGARAPSRQGGSQRLEAVGDADAARAPGRWRWRRRRGARSQAELEPVDAGGVGEVGRSASLGDRRLRHAEAAEGAGDRVVGVDRRGRGRRTCGTR